MAYNLRAFRQNPWGEIAGSMGDLGTLLPIMTAMALSESISLNSTLVFTGLSNILTGAFFGVPVVVQPMKLIASISLSRNLSLEETMGAGFSVGIIVLLLAVTGLLEWAGKIVPVPIVKGIQLGAGLSLVMNAGASLNKLPWLSWNMNNILWAAVATFLLFATFQNSKFPLALIIFTIGILSSIVALPILPVFGIQRPQLMVPQVEAIKKGLISAGIGQLPLTILNSVIAVTHLSQDLLPLRPAPSVSSLGVSVGLMNIVGCMFGSMPVCHGSGGYAAQYRFGARSGMSVMLLGVAKPFIGLFVGYPLLAWLRGFPAALLGVMVFAAGIELAAVAQTLNSGSHSQREAKERWLVMLVTAGGLLAFKDAMAGFVLGSAFWATLLLQDRITELSPAWFGSRNGETQPLLA